MTLLVVLPGTHVDLPDPVQIPLSFPTLPPEVPSIPLPRFPLDPSPTTSHHTLIRFVI